MFGTIKKYENNYLRIKKEDEMMNEFGKFGTLHGSNGRYALRFERFFSR